MEQGRSTSLRYNQQSKLPRDISESLGKLPPQAVDLEEFVLGAILMDKNAWARVSAFLSHTHFYIEAHREIFATMEDLVRQQKPIDSRTVLYELRRVGKIDLIGGVSRIPELTSTISSAENIEAHGRILVEMALKRELIQVASEIHHHAYQDTQDAFLLLKSSIERLQWHQAATTENNVNKIQAIWPKIILTEKPPHRDPILRIDNLPVFTPGNHSMILGKMKSRKTLFLTWLIHQSVLQRYLKPEQIMLFDTEQGDEDVWEVREKIRKLVGTPVNVFMLRGCDHKERLQIIDQTIDHWPVRPRWVIVDGVRDLMANINSEQESNEIITWLQKRTYRQDLHITEILHMNKGNDNARGHIGTELLNRTEVTIELELDKDPTYTHIKCAISRRRAFNPLVLTHGPAPDYLPQMVGMIIGNEPVTQDTERDKVLKMFCESSTLKYRDFLEEIRDSFSCSERKARILIKTYQERGWVIRIGNPRSRDTSYKLMLSSTSTNIMTANPITQTEMFVSQTPEPTHQHTITTPIPEPQTDEDDLPF